MPGPGMPGTTPTEHVQSLYAAKAPRLCVVLKSQSQCCENRAIAPTTTPTQPRCRFQVGLNARISANTATQKRNEPRTFHASNSLHSGSPDGHPLHRRARAGSCHSQRASTIEHRLRAVHRGRRAGNAEGPMEIHHRALLGGVSDPGGILSHRSRPFVSGGVADHRWESLIASPTLEAQAGKVWTMPLA